MKDLAHGMAKSGFLPSSERAGPAGNGNRRNDRARARIIDRMNGRRFRLLAELPAPVIAPRRSGRIRQRPNDVSGIAQDIPVIGNGTGGAEHGNQDMHDRLEIQLPD